METKVIVKCTSDILSEEITTRLSISQRAYYPVTVGDTYVVLGLTFAKNPALLGNEGAVLIAPNNQYMEHAPLALFEVIDPRVSPNWIWRKNQLGDICLWPISFFREYYLDDLIEGVPDVMQDFRSVFDFIVRESANSDKPPE